MQRTFYDTTELVKPFARRLHATLTEIRGNKVRVSPTVAWELGKRGAIKSPGTAISVAEAELQQKTPPLSEGQRSRLEREAWWAQQWLDRESVHEKVELSDKQMEIRDGLLGAITRHAFPKLGGVDVSENRDSVIICEVMALEGELLLTHNINSIDHAIVNEWAIETGPRFGVRGQAVVTDADRYIATWAAESRTNAEQWIKAGLLTYWPKGGNDDSAPAGRVLHTTREGIEQITSRGGRLKEACAEMLRQLEKHPYPKRLVEESRQVLPSRALGGERQHPGYYSR